MSEALSSQERKRENLYKQLQETGDLRRGTISATYRTDITYIRLIRGFVYLAAVIDWYSRKVLVGRLRSGWISIQEIGSFWRATY